MIARYELTGTSGSVSIPGSFRVLDVGLQVPGISLSISLWCDVTPANPNVTVDYQILEEGDDQPSGWWGYLGMVWLAGQKHVFARAT